MRIQAIHDSIERNGQFFSDAVCRVMRQCAQRLLQRAIEIEADRFIGQHADRLESDGRRQVVRHGYMPPRMISTGAGPLTIKRPRIRDRAYRVAFTSSILRRYARATSAAPQYLLLLYAGGYRRRDFNQAVCSILGIRADLLDAELLDKITEIWHDEYGAWRRRNLTGSYYACVWAGSACVALEHDPRNRTLLVLIGRTVDGAESILMVTEGDPRDKAAWRRLLYDVQRIGLRTAPGEIVGDRRLGLWSTFSRIFPTTIQRRR